jgi:hypothetical protein
VIVRSMAAVDVCTAAGVQSGAHSLCVVAGMYHIHGMCFLNGTQCIDGYSILPALTLDGIISCGVVEASFTTTLFIDFMCSLLESGKLAPGSVLVMDNCRIHKSDILCEMVEEQCMSFCVPAEELALHSVVSFLSTCRHTLQTSTPSSQPSLPPRPTSATEPTSFLLLWVRMMILLLFTCSMRLCTLCLPLMIMAGTHTAPTCNHDALGIHC